MTGAVLRMTWLHFFVPGSVLQTHGLEKSQNALVRGRQLCIHTFILKECSQNCFLFDVVNLENRGNLAEQVHFKLADRQIERQRQG